MTGSRDVAGQVCGQINGKFIKPDDFAHADATLIVQAVKAEPSGSEIILIWAQKDS